VEGNLHTGVAVTPDGTKVYVVNELKGTVSVIDTATNTITNTIKVGENPCGVAIGNFMGNAQDTTPKTPAGFNILILAAMSILYIWKKSTRK